MPIVIKVGGSLLAHGHEILHLLSDYAAKKGLVFIIVPGGGPFVEPVRELSRQGRVTEEAAHWMAVLAMHQYGFFLAEGARSIRSIPLVERLEELSGAGHICILLPYTILRADDSLPHTWDVTSDTIAAFVAHKIGASSFIKVTDVDGILAEDGSLIKEITALEMITRGMKGCVDAALPGFLLRNRMSCIIVNGNFPERILAVIEGKPTLCTAIVHAGRRHAIPHALEWGSKKV